MPTQQVPTDPGALANLTSRLCGVENLETSAKCPFSFAPLTKIESASHTRKESHSKGCIA